MVEIGLCELCSPLHECLLSVGSDSQEESLCTERISWVIGTVCALHLKFLFLWCILYVLKHLGSYSTKAVHAYSIAVKKNTKEKVGKMKGPLHSPLILLTTTHLPLFWHAWLWTGLVVMWNRLSLPVLDSPKAARAWLCPFINRYSAEEKWLIEVACAIQTTSPPPGVKLPTMAIQCRERGKNPVCLTWHLQALQSSRSQYTDEHVSDVVFGYLTLPHDSA